MVKNSCGAVKRSFCHWLPRPSGVSPLKGAHFSTSNCGLLLQLREDGRRGIADLPAGHVDRAQVTVVRQLAGVGIVDKPFVGQLQPGEGEQAGFHPAGIDRLCR